MVKTPDSEVPNIDVLENFQKKMKARNEKINLVSIVDNLYAKELQ